MMESGSFRTSLVAFAATGCIAGAVLAVNTNVSTVLGTDAAGVWFANDASNSVSHLGPGGVDAAVGVDGTVGSLSVVKIDGVAFVGDDSGQLLRIDPKRLEVTERTQLPSGNTRFVAGDDRLYALDDAADTIREIDTMLRPLGLPVTIDADLGAAVVAAGVLWVADDTSGDVLSFADAAVDERVEVGQPGTVLALSAVGTEVIAVDASATRATIVNNSRAGTTFDLGVSVGPSVDIPASVESGQVLPILGSPTTLVLLDLTTGNVRTIELPDRDHRFGTPRVAAEKVYVPDYTDGRLLVVDVASGVADTPITLKGRPGEFDVVVDRSTVYVNDRGSERAWAIDAGGNVTQATKYDPNGTVGGSGRAVTIPDAPPLSPPSTTPPDPPSNGSPPPTTTPTTTPRNDSAPPTTAPPLIIVPVVNPPRNSQGPPGGPPSGPPGNPGTTVTSTTTVPTNRSPGDSPTTTTPATTPSSTVPAGGGAPTTVPPSTVPPTTGPPAPVVPGQPARIGSVAGDGQVTVSWSAPPLVGFELREFIVTNTTTGARLVVGPSASSIAITGLSNGTAYQFSVAAVSTAGQEGPASAATAPVIPAGSPGAPTITSLTADSPTTISVSFSTAASSNGTNIGSSQVTLNPGGVTQTVTSATGGSAIFSGLSQETAYTVTVVAVGTNGLSSAPAAGSTTTPTGRPGAVTSLTLEANDRTLSWGAAPGAVGYRVYVDSVLVVDTPSLAANVGFPDYYDVMVNFQVTPYNSFGDGPSRSINRYFPGPICPGGVRCIPP
jgi:hypothetical protein